MDPSLLQDLLDRFGPDRVSTGTTERLIYARDLWALQTLRAREGLLPPSPGVVVWPRSEEEVVALVRLARAHHVSITPYGGGSGVLGGAIAAPNAILVDLKRMSTRLELHPLDGTCTVDPGVLGWHLEERLNEQGYSLGHFPSSLMTASVGGYVATRSAGQFSSRYGKIEDMVVSLRFVTGTGEVIDTADGALEAGPDLSQLYMGCEGTLGIVTRITLRIHPMAPASAWRGFRFKGLEPGLNAMRMIMQAGHRPSVLRLYDELDTFIVGRGDRPLEPGQPEVAEETAGGAESAEGDAAGQARKARRKSRIRSVLDRFPQAVRGAVRVALERPVLLERLSGRLLPRELLLVVGIEGEAAEVEKAMPDINALCALNGGIDLGPGPGLRWLEKRYDVSFKAPTFFHLGAFVDTIEVATTWEKIPKLYQAVRSASGDEVMVMAHFSHAYHEGVSIYFSLAGSAPDLPTAELRYKRAWEKAMEAVLAEGATVSHHHGVGVMKAPWATREHAGFLPLYGRLKSSLDPDGILNPGKLYLR